MSLSLGVTERSSMSPFVSLERIAPCERYVCVSLLLFVRPASQPARVYESTSCCDVRSCTVQRVDCLRPNPTPRHRRNKIAMSDGRHSLYTRKLLYRLGLLIAYIGCLLGSIIITSAEELTTSFERERMRERVCVCVCVYVAGFVYRSKQFLVQ